MCIYCLIENSLSKNLHMYNILKLFFLAIRNICLLILKWVQVNLWTDSYSFICFSISCFKIIVFFSLSLFCLFGNCLFFQAKPLLYLVHLYKQQTFIIISTLSNRRFHAYIYSDKHTHTH